MITMCVFICAYIYKRKPHNVRNMECTLTIRKNLMEKYIVFPIWEICFIKLIVICNRRESLGHRIL